MLIFGVPAKSGMARNRRRLAAAVLMFCPRVGFPMLTFTDAYSIRNALSVNDVH